MGIDTKFLPFVTFFPCRFVECALFQLHHGHTGLALAVPAQPEALNGPVFLQQLVDGGPQRGASARPL